MYLLNKTIMSIQIIIFLSLAIGFTVVYFVIPKIIKVSTEKKLFDVPNHRSAAKKIVPTLGGIALFAGFRISQIISLDSFNTNELKYMSLGTLVMFILGLKDDLISVSAKMKLMIQIVVASYLVIIGGYHITNLSGIFGLYSINQLIGSILSIVFIVGIINAINLIDGIDGLASGISILITVVYGSWFLNAGDLIYAITCFSMTGSLIAFFLYNVFGKTNKIFMGDTGSLILGIVIALLSIHFIEFKSTVNSSMVGLPSLALAVLIVPVIDTIRVMAIRIFMGKSPFTPDMNHIHHDVLKLTGSHLLSSLIIITVNALFILLAFNLITIIGNGTLFFLLFVLGFIVASIPTCIMWFRNKNSVNRNPGRSVFALSIFTKKGNK